MFVYVFDIDHSCRCERRQEAQRAGELIYSVAAGGYIFVRDIPRRTDGSHFIFTCCPFCGGDLPRD